VDGKWIEWSTYVSDVVYIVYIATIGTYLARNMYLYLACLPLMIFFAGTVTYPDSDESPPPPPFPRSPDSHKYTSRQSYLGGDTNLYLGANMWTGRQLLTKPLLFRLNISASPTLVVLVHSASRRDCIRTECEAFFTTVILAFNVKTRIQFCKFIPTRPEKYLNLLLHHFNCIGL
jgi:hypothetical protein